ncbi:MAG: NUDIX domain-containing protein [Rhodocyclaceae bacterium]|nr:NUDIX domain-containing protein [Rhodocyclaceae bacterium]
MKAMIDALAEQVPEPADGLPEELFLWVSSLTPMVNVDLMIHDAEGRALLTWRHDRFYGPGWHVPGGIIRFKERTASRIAAVAAHELGARVRCTRQPVAIHEVMHPNRRVRGHFISLLYACRLVTPPDASRRHRIASPRPGDWAWHRLCPPDLIPVHEIYRDYIERRRPFPKPEDDENG